MLEAISKESIRIQVELNRNTNLFYKGYPENTRIYPDLLHLIWANAASSPEEQTRLIDFATRLTVKVVWQKNQYVSISENKKRELRDIYAKTLRLAREGCHEKDLIQSHQKRISGWVKCLYPKDYVDALQSIQQIGSVPCAEYSSELIENVYQIVLDRLKEPILDIGCGENAHFVKKLQKIGKRVQGFDRCSEEHFDAVNIGDWLEYAYGLNQWGSIFANMSFSNHYIYHQTQQTEQAEIYSSVYQSICRSLFVGGRFYYARHY